jgi:hypothetical protein
MLRVEEEVMKVKIAKNMFFNDFSPFLDMDE